MISDPDTRITSDRLQAKHSGRLSPLPVAVPRIPTKRSVYQQMLQNKFCIAHYNMQIIPTGAHLTLVTFDLVTFEMTGYRSDILIETDALYEKCLRGDVVSFEVRKR